jgi:3-hydroxyacyl-CoA dehydrogenase/enoyl-CoA hydratase/3-hydroxybutyryl-CoA epimerase
MKKLADGRNTVKHVHVIGAGAMGGDIAAWCASQGLRVTLADMKAEPVAGAIKRARICSARSFASRPTGVMRWIG